MLSTSTHDSKRSEDVRTRIDVLSEIPGEWRLHLRRWRDWNRGKKVLLDGLPMPTRNDEYLLYQTLLGAWPATAIEAADWDNFIQRIDQYMLKALREAKEYTSWANTNTDYESAVSRFVHAILERNDENQFISDFADFQRRVARVAAFNSLSQTLLKLTSPGVPDIYQGNELLHFTLVDPDNRHPVDYDVRRKQLDDLMRAAPSREFLGRLSGDPAHASAKLYMTWKALNIRKQHAALFQRGDYIPLAVMGEKSNHVVAFARNFEGRSAVIAAPRLCAKLLGDSNQTLCDPVLWDDTNAELPDFHASCYHNVFTGECVPAAMKEPQRLSLSNLFRHFPVALLVSEPSGRDSSDCE